jgi:hypothetical protein
MDRAKKFRNWGIVVFVLFLLELFFNFNHHFLYRSLTLYPYPVKVFISITRSPFLILSAYLFLKFREIQQSNGLAGNTVIRSAGVSMFGGYMILSSIQAIIGICYFNPEASFAIKILGIVSVPISIILGFNILKLKEWARKWFVYYCIIIVLIGPYCFTNSLLKSKLKGTPIPVSILGLTIVLLLCVSLPLFFITRPKVKAQFK